MNERGSKAAGKGEQAYIEASESNKKVGIC
jgi:hypothetical protein